jgi:thymidylate synthase
LGVPFNIASYAMFTKVIAQQAGFETRRFIHSFGSAHFYCGTGERGRWYGEHLDEFRQKVGQCMFPDDYNEARFWLERNLPPEAEGQEGYDHVTAIIEQLARPTRPLPKMTIADKPFYELKREDFKLESYDPWPKIERKMAV